MSLKYGILGFLSYGNMTGYDLSKAFHESVDNFWHASSSQIYRELHLLEKLGHVKSEQILQTEKPNKKMYSITTSGQEDFFAWLSQLDTDSLFPIRSAFLMRVFFSGMQSPQNSLTLLSTYEARCAQALQELGQWQKSAEHYKSEVQNDKESLYWLLTADYGRRYLEMGAEWAREAQQTLLQAAEKEIL